MYIHTCDFDDPVPTQTTYPAVMQSAGEDDDGDHSLDFTSAGFDALKALHTDPSQLQLPYPTVQPCDNLDAYQSSNNLY